MVSKRHIERLPALVFEPEPEAIAAIAPHRRVPGQPGYPQARAMEHLRHKHVTRVRQLGRK